VPTIECIGTLAAFMFLEGAVDLVAFGRSEPFDRRELGWETKT
jgi:hypothetical protein